MIKYYFNPKDQTLTVFNPETDKITVMEPLNSDSLLCAENLKA